MDGHIFDGHIFGHPWTSIFMVGSLVFGCSMVVWWMAVRVMQVLARLHRPD